MEVKESYLACFHPLSMPKRSKITAQINASKYLKNALTLTVFAKNVSQKLKFTDVASPCRSQHWDFCMSNFGPAFEHFAEIRDFAETQDICQKPQTTSATRHCVKWSKLGVVYACKRTQSNL